MLLEEETQKRRKRQGAGNGFFSGMIDLQGYGHRILSGKVGVPGLGSVDLVQGRYVGELQEPGLSGYISPTHVIKKLQPKENSDTEVFQTVMLQRSEGYEIKDFFFGKSRKLCMTLSGSGDIMK
ncbi:hypothetical protein VULLAG_LOCUS8964 [Vulpes lagopus]